MEWLEYAAKHGSHYAAYRVGKEYLHGKIVKKDASKAVGYFEKAANADNQYAQYMLGKLLLLGREVQRDRELALHWLTRSADQGNEYAQFFLDRADSFQPPSVMLAATRLLHHIVRVKTTIRENQFAQKHDILICARNGSRTLVGKCALISDMGESASFGAFMAIYRTKYHKYIAHYQKFIREECTNEALHWPRSVHGLIPGEPARSQSLTCAQPDPALLL